MVPTAGVDVRRYELPRQPPRVRRPRWYEAPVWTATVWGQTYSVAELCRLTGQSGRGVLRDLQGHLWCGEFTEDEPGRFTRHPFVPCVLANGALYATPGGWTCIRVDSDGARYWLARTA